MSGGAEKPAWRWRCGDGLPGAAALSDRPSREECCSGTNSPAEVSGISVRRLTRTVDVHIALLRRKLENNPQFQKHIPAVRGSGLRALILDQLAMKVYKPWRRIRFEIPPSAPDLVNDTAAEPAETAIYLERFYSKLRRDAQGLQVRPSGDRHRAERERSDALQPHPPDDGRSREGRHPRPGRHRAGVPDSSVSGELRRLQRIDRNFNVSGAG